jgi:hypothetical protein
MAATIARLATRAVAVPAFAGKTLTFALRVARSPGGRGGNRRQQQGPAVFTGADVMRVLR